MHEVVHANKPTSGRNVIGVGVPGVQENSHVMVPVQEDQRLLSENDKHGITKFRDLAQSEHPVPEATHAVVQEAETEINKIRYCKEFIS